MGVISFYASYVPEFARLAAPLTEKLKVGREEGKKGSKVVVTWTPEQLQAFKDLKEALLHTVPLQSAQPDKPYVIRCDASDLAVGAVLEQHPQDDDDPRPLSEQVITDKCT